MKYWKLLGHESEPKGIGKIMSICLFIVLLNGYVLEGFIDHYILDIISYTCVGVFSYYLCTILLENKEFRNHSNYLIIKGLSLNCN